MNHAKEADAVEMTSHPSGHFTGDSVTMCREPVPHNDDLQPESGWGQIYSYPIHTTLFLSPKDIFSCKKQC